MLISTRYQAAALLTSSLFSQGTPTPVHSNGPQCRDIVIPVTISANNAALPANLSLSDPTAVASVLGNISFTQPVQGTFNIAGRYCEPEVNIPSRQNSLQLLVHGLSYNRNYWSGDFPPGEGNDFYSWIAFASKQGYPTLSIDRLGNGLSDHPDPIAVVQVPAQVETVHEIIAAAYSGLAPFPRAFNNVIYSGHSLGSIIANGLNAKYPSDANVTILTGFSDAFQNATEGAVGQIAALSAHLVNATKWGNLSDGYVAGTNEAGLTFLFYYGPKFGYDPALAHHDFLTRGSFSIGEVITLLVTVGPALEYTAPVFIVTGQHDAVICGKTGVPPTPGDCGPHATGILSQTKALYPAVDSFDWYAPPRSGHDWQFNFDAFETYGIVHDWLAIQGF